MRRTLKAFALALLCLGWSAAAQQKINPSTQVNWPAGCQYYNVALNSCPPLSQINFRGTWSSASTYAANDAVYYNGTQYISLQNSNINHPPDTAPTYWAVLVAGSTVQVNGVALQTPSPQNFQNSPTVTFTNTSAGNITASVSTTTLAQQVTAPLSGGQYVVLYANAFTPTTGDGGTGGLSGGKTSAAIVNGPGGGPLSNNTWGITFSNFVLPADIPAGNVTSVYAFMVSSVTGNNSVNYGTCTGTGGGAGLTPGGNLTTGTNWIQKQFTGLTGISGANIGTISCNARTERSMTTVFTELYSIPSVGLIVYYTGTPSTYGSTAAQVASPLYFSAVLNQLGIDSQASFHGLDLLGVPIGSLPAQPLTSSLAMLINNGSTSSDCTTGGGANYVLCRWNGTNWASFVVGGGITALTGDVSASGSGSVASTVTQTHLAAPLPIAQGGTGTASPGLVAGANMTVTGTWPNQTLASTGGGGGGGVQYNPANTLYVFTGDSILGDDTQVLAPQITITGGTCNGTICTFTNSGTNGLVAGDWIYQGVAGLPATPAPFGTVSTTYGFFQVLSSGLTSTQFAFNYPSVATVTGGTVQKANYFVAQAAMQQPFFNGHGNFQVITDASYTVAATDADYTALFHSISPAVTGNTPEYLILNDIINNDIQGCASAATIEGHLQSLWQKAHTDGWIVVQGSNTMSPFNSLTCGPAYTNLWLVNQWLYGQGKTAYNTTGASNGMYWDRLFDVGAVFPNPLDTTVVASNGTMAPGGVLPYTATLNQAMANQASEPKTRPYYYFGASNVGGNTRGEVHVPSVDSFHAFTVTNAANTQEEFTVNTNQHIVSGINGSFQSMALNYPGTGSYGHIYEFLLPSMNTGAISCGTTGHQNASNDHWYMCFNNVGGAGASTNTMVMGLHGGNNYTSWMAETTNFTFRTDGSMQIPGGIDGNATAPTGACTANGRFVFTLDGNVTWCSGGTWTPFGGSSTFATLGGGTNTSAAMHCGNGCSVDATGTGTVTATNIPGLVQAGAGTSVTGSGSVASPYVVAVSGTGGSATVGSAEVVTFSATPTFSAAYNTSRMTLTGNVTSFTMSPGVDGQMKTLCVKQGSGPYTVTAPAAVHGFFTIGTTNAGWNCQSFTYDNTDSIWLATTLGVINQ